MELSISDVQKAFLESDLLGDTFTVTNNRNYAFIFVLKSRLPLVSTMTTNGVPDLQGASVSCEDLSTAEVDASIIHIVNGMCFVSYGQCINISFFRASIKSV